MGHGSYNPWGIHGLGLSGPLTRQGIDSNTIVICRRVNEYSKLAGIVEGFAGQFLST